MAGPWARTLVIIAGKHKPYQTPGWLNIARSALAHLYVVMSMRVYPLFPLSNLPPGLLLAIPLNHVNRITTVAIPQEHKA